MYKEVFAINPIRFPEETTNNNQYFLKNYNHYEPKLVSDHYLNSFKWMLLFEMNIINLTSFLNSQLDTSNNPEKLISILENLIMPSVDNIISNAIINSNAIEYRDEKVLDDGFIETPDKIFCSYYEDEYLFHYCAIKKLQSDLLKRKEIVFKFISLEQTPDNNTNEKKLMWKAKPSHLCIIIAELVDAGYIEAPIGHDNEINYSALAKQIINSFATEVEWKSETLRRYLSSSGHKQNTLREKFNNNGFLIPNSGIVG